MKTPERTRVYQCHHFDSTRWDYYTPRDDDIIIATSYKAGTTWTQGIVANLLFPDGEFPAPPSMLSPWVDMRFVPLEVFLNGIEAQTSRRFLKTHLPLDGMRYEPQLKYVYVSRDGRDVFMSMWNHYSNMKRDKIDHMNEIPGRAGDPFPYPPSDIHDFWKTWVSDNWFDGEVGGWPYWSHLSNVQTWWDYRHLPNIEFFHYNDLLERPEQEIRRLADYLEIEVPEQYWSRILEAVSFDSMKARGDDYVPDGGAFWEGGANTFLNKGVNGRWNAVLTDEELAQYDAACEKALTPDCRQWLESGRGASA
jgi:aryl sulfotransferase